MSLTSLGLKEVFLDLHSRFIGSFFAKEGERNSRGLLVNVLDNSSPVTISGMTAKLYVQLADGRVYEEDATITDNKFRIIYPANVLKSGKADAEIRIYKGDDNIASKTFQIDIGRAILSEDLIEGSDELGLMEQLRVAAKSEDERIANEQLRVDEEQQRQENEIIRQQRSELMSTKVATLDKEIQQHKSTVASVNVNQEAKQTAEGRRVVSLPKTAGEGHGEFGLQGLTATNLVENGDFRDGLDGWTKGRDDGNSTHISENGLVFNQEGWSHVTQEANHNIDDEYYIRVKCTIIGNFLTARVGFGTSHNGNYPSITSSTLLISDSGYKSSIVSIDSSAKHFGVFTQGGRKEEERKLTIRSIQLINLTQTFGAGNEPTKEECDQIFANYFEGTQSVNGNVRVKSGESTYYLNAPKLRSLPNGVRDEIKGTELIKRISDTGELLEEPEITQLHPSGNLITQPSGTAFVEDVVADVVTYTDKVTTKQPVYKLDQLSVIDFQTGGERKLDVSKAVIAEDKLSFTHPELSNGDIVFFDYFYDEEGTDGLASVSYHDSRYTIKDSVTDKVYQWNISIADGVPSIKLEEV